MSNLSELIGLRKDFSAIEQLEILDLGSGDVLCKILSLIKNFRNEFRYTAVDRKSECFIFHESRYDEENCDQQINGADWIKRINVNILSESQEDIPITDIDFIEMFSLNFDQDALQFCLNIQGKKKYDIIVISNLLHFLKEDKAAELIHLIKSLLNENALIYIEVLNNEQTVYERENLYDRECFNNIKKGFEIIREEKSEYHLSFAGFYSG